MDWEDTQDSANSQLDTAADLPDEAVEKLYFQENEKNRFLIDSTVAYRTSGVLPTLADKMPNLVAAQTSLERDAGKPVHFGGEA